MKIESLGGRPLCGDRLFLIAEAGVNHEGSFETALQMIDEAAAAGADAIKFQCYKAERLASRESPAYWDTSRETARSQFELFRRYEAFDGADYARLAARCEERGILFMATPFDDFFVDALEGLVPAYKVASADITNHLLLRRVAACGLPVLLSVGASYLGEVDEALRVLANAGAREVAILHCVLQYPTDAKNANLRSIPYLRQVFPNATIGWSDHLVPEYGCASVLTAWLLGAEIVEKHFTLDKSLPGNDHYHAMDPDDIRDLRAREAFVRSMLGSYGKTLLPCEEVPRQFARRSLVTTCEIPAGAPLTEDMITAKRPGTGISPADLDRVLGQRALNHIPEDTILGWEMLRGDGA